MTLLLETVFLEMCPSQMYGGNCTLYRFKLTYFWFKFQAKDDLYMISIIHVLGVINESETYKKYKCFMHKKDNQLMVM